MILFYEPEISINSVCTLSPDESRHVVQVLRLKKGNLLHITNGKGSLFIAELLDDNHKRCAVMVKEEQYFKENDSNIHIAVAPTKNMERMEWFVEKAVELGIDEITPIICKHSERKEIKTERLNKVAVAAMKQSLKYRLPIINEAVKFDKLIKECMHEQKFICFGEASPDNNLSTIDIHKGQNIFLIGPEGDFSDEEIQAAKAQGFLGLFLGNSRLRTETAALHVVSICHYKNQVSNKY
ncbi:MAG: 16S rRNA (uracil(1498)-N(3))-methyltransferase [Bacteroidia bacterium]|nr:16S rRNA (uracil(1498)-N(3))-methyltransferase [Bacteroidia bacterium]